MCDPYDWSIVFTVDSFKAVEDLSNWSIPALVEEFTYLLTYSIDCLNVNLNVNGPGCETCQENLDILRFAILSKIYA